MCIWFWFSLWRFVLGNKLVHCLSHFCWLSVIPFRKYLLICLWLPSHLLPLDLLKCSRQAWRWLAFIFYLIFKFFRWIMGFLIVKSPFLETSFSRNPICFQIFYLTNVFLCHFCYAHVANPGLEWQEADFRVRAGWPGTPAVLVVNVRCLACAAPSPRLPGGRLSCSPDPGSPWLYPEAWSSLASCFHLPHDSHGVRL